MSEQMSDEIKQKVDKFADKVDQCGSCIIWLALFLITGGIAFMMCFG